MTINEEKVINGITYKRCTESGFEQKFWYSAKNTLGNEGYDHPHIVCNCGSTTFELRYGSYEIIARCDKCGLEEDVYSG